MDKAIENEATKDACDDDDAEDRGNFIYDVGNCQTGE